MTRRLRDFYLTLDLRSLGLYRILLGALLLHDACVRWADLEAFYTARGVLPADALAVLPGRTYSLLQFIDNPFGVRAFFLLAMAAFVALLVGWRTRIASVVALVAYASIRNRNVFVSHGGDSTLLVLLLWSVFLPLGARFSFDAVRAALRRGVDLDAPRPIPATLRTVPGLASLALPLQMGLIYLTTAIAKSGSTWRDGTAVYYALELDAFALPLGIAMRDLPLALTKLVTWATLGLEYVAFPMFFLPWGQPWLRRIALAALVAMHLGHALTLSIGGFPWAMLCGLVVFLGAEDWAWIAARARRGARAATVVYDDACGFCTRVCRIVKLADTGGRLRFVGASARSALAPTVPAELATASAVVVDAATGAPATRAAAAARVAGALPWPWRAAGVLAWPGVRVVADLVYDWVARHRGRISQWCGDVACGVAPPAGGAAPRHATAAASRGARARARATDAAVAILLIAMLLDAWERRIVTRFNARRLPNPTAARTVVAAFDLRTGWPMFAPDPLAADGWWVVEGIGTDGNTYDPLAHGPVQWERPQSLATRHDPYWRAYLHNMSLPGNYPIRLPFGRYLADRAAADGHPLARLDFAYVQETTPPPGTPRPFPTKTIRLWEYDVGTDRTHGPTPASLR